MPGRSPVRPIQSSLKPSMSVSRTSCMTPSRTKASYPSMPGIENYGVLHGIELVRRFQYVVHDALHAVKPDALLETQTPNPLFRESSDMLRLNDIWFATRDLPEMMRERARIARIAGWELLDCDNASPTVIDEWIRYTQLQPYLGVPSLYFLTETESSHERMTRAQSDYLRSIWREYIVRNAL